MSEPQQQGIEVYEIREAIAGALNIATAGISDDVDLVQLGLDSIRTMTLAGDWRRRGYNVNFAQLVATPTVTDWYRLLTAAAPSEVGEVGESAGPTVDAAVDAELEPFALAPMQHAYWIGRSDEQEWGGVAAHLYVEFDGERVDPQRMRAAVADLVARHPMLRTAVLPDGNGKTLAAPMHPVFTVLDLRRAPDAFDENGLEQVRRRMTHQRMAVADGQVIEVVLTLLPHGRTRLHIDLDMIAADALSYRILVADLAELYCGRPLPEHTYSYRRYRTEHTRDPIVYERDRQWWQRRLDRLPGPPDLPTVPVVQQREKSHTVRYHYWLAPESKRRLLGRSHERGLTPAAALAAVFAETIGGWSMQRRFLLNVPLFHRDRVHPGVDRVVGDFSSSIMLEVDLTDPMTVAQRARALQRTMHDSAAHSSYSGLEVLRDLGRHRGGPMLAPVVYTSALNLGELFSESATDVFGEPGWIVSQGPQVLLDAQVTEVDRGLLLNWDVRADVFPDGMVDAMFAHYRDAIDRLADTRASWDAAAAVRLPRAQATVRARVNATAGPVSGRCLHQGFFDYAAATPEAPAVIWTVDDVDGGWTYRELAQLALTVAGALVNKGVLPGDAVAVWLPKGPDQIAAVLGVLAAGAGYVPVGFDQPSARREKIICGGGVVAAVVPEGADIGVDVMSVPIHESMRFDNPLAEPIFPATDAIGYVIFTSGSTGVPKGVEVAHAAAMNTIDAVNARFDMGTEDGVLALSALEFDASVYDMFGMFSVGGRVVAVSAVQRGEAGQWVELLRRHRVSVLNCVPAMLDMVLNIGGEDLGDSLRVVTLGGDRVDADLARRLARQVPGCRFAGLGGATETAIHNTICEISDPPADWIDIPFGIPLRNVKCRVVSDNGRDCPDWVAGELWVGGAGLATGYRGDPDLTARKFVEYRGERWYRTGDRARYLPNGMIEFLGRADHQVQIRGYRVELGEVETALRSLPGITQAVAATTGGGTPKLVAAVCGASCTESDVIVAITDILPDYMIPCRVDIVERMPLTGNGKLDRRAVVERLGSAPADPRGRQPRTELERALVDIVQEVLRVDGVGVQDDFFRIGGDSVSATSVIARLRGYLDIDHAVVADIFTTRTVAALAQRLLRREVQADRLEHIARIFREVQALSDAEVSAQLTRGA